MIGKNYGAKGRGHCYLQFTVEIYVACNYAKAKHSHVANHTVVGNRLLPWLLTMDFLFFPLDLIR